MILIIKLKDIQNKRISRQQFFCSLLDEPSLKSIEEIVLSLLNSSVHHLLTNQMKWNGIDQPDLY